MKKTHLNALLSLCLFTLPLRADNSEPTLEETAPALTSQNPAALEAETVSTTPDTQIQSTPQNADEKYVGQAAQEGSSQGAQNDWGKYVVAATVVGAAITAIVLVANNK